MPKLDPGCVLALGFRIRRLEATVADPKIIEMVVLP
jgi:hypothetical protein